MCTLSFLSDYLDRSGFDYYANIVVELCETVKLLRASFTCNIYIGVLLYNQKRERDNKANRKVVKSHRVAERLTPLHIGKKEHWKDRNLPFPDHKLGENHTKTG